MGEKRFKSVNFIGNRPHIFTEQAEKASNKGWALPCIIVLRTYPVMRNYTFRLGSGQDLFDSIEAIVREQSVEAGCILSGVGSLTRVSIRLASRDEYSIYEGFFEIVSLTGTLSIHGSHVHISVADEQGKTFGGHLGSGCKIYTTSEIVLAVFDDVVYKREHAEDSGYEELAVYRKHDL